MGEIRMLNLYRCSSAKDIDVRPAGELNQGELRYFVTDYFDEIKVETLDIRKASLQHCIGELFFKLFREGRRGLSMSETLNFQTFLHAQMCVWASACRYAGADGC